MSVYGRRDESGSRDPWRYPGQRHCRGHRVFRLQRDGRHLAGHDLSSSRRACTGTASGSPSSSGLPWRIWSCARLHRILTRIYLPYYFIGRARTSDGLLGDPVNVALLGSEEQLHSAMHQAGWTLADDVDLGEQPTDRHRDADTAQLRRGPGQPAVPFRPAAGFRVPAGSRREPGEAPPHPLLALPAGVGPARRGQGRLACRRHL